MKQSKFIQATLYNTRRKAKTASKIVSRRLRFGLKEQMDANMAYLQDILDLASCASPDTIFNTGIPLCDVVKKKIKGVLFLDSGVTFSGAEIASVPAFIQAVKDKTVAARGSRVYPVWDLLNFEDNTSEPATGSTGNLSTGTTIVSDAVPVFRFGYSGSEARHKQIAAMISAGLDVMLIDEAFTVYGCVTEDGTAFRGFDVLQQYADPSRFPVGDTVNQYSFRLTLSSVSQYRDTPLFVVTNAGILAAAGLINVTMKEFSLVSNVLKVYMLSAGGTNIEPLHGAALDGLTWTAKDLDNNVAVVISAVATDATNDVMGITFETVQYAALASGTRIAVYGPTASAMAAAGVKPFEFIPFIFEKP